MNLTEALNVALPELPVQQRKRKALAKVDPTLITRESVEEGKPVVLVLVPGTSNYYGVPAEQWQLLQLYDGVRSYQEIADTYTAMTGTAISEEEVRSFAEETTESPFWYKSQQERNLTLMEKLRDERTKRLKRKSKWGDMAMIQFPSWNPDRFLDKLYARLQWMFTPWFVLVNLAMFAFMIYIFASHWTEITRDTLEYYTFTGKGLGHLAEFWVLVFVLSFFHEVAHGVTCKHAGGNVYKLGFMLIYLSPAFFCDVSQAWVYSGKWMRIATAAAGMWVELVLSAIATFVWWATPPGTFVHDFSYTIVLVSGIAVLVINMNPLIKLDGYIIFTELLEVVELKERSTAFVSGWVKKHIFHLPAELELLPFRRKLLFVPYALISGVYSYLLLFVIVRFAYNVVHRFTPEWAFVPAIGIGYLIFKSRIRNFGRFMKLLYLDKWPTVQAWVRGPRKWAVALAGIVVLVAPLWRQSVDSRFLLEPIQRAVVRTVVPGTVTQVTSAEGSRIPKGAPLLKLDNLGMLSEAALAEAQLQKATAIALEAESRHADFAAALHAQQEAAERNRILQEQVRHLQVVSPIAGTVLTPRLSDLLGSNLAAGSQIAEVGDLNTMRATIYVPETEIRRVGAGSPVRLYLPAAGRSLHNQVAEVLPAAVDMAEGLTPKQPYKGITPPHFYLMYVLLPNQDGMLKDGTTGDAKILLPRRSIAGLIGETVSHFVGRKLW